LRFGQLDQGSEETVRFGKWWTWIVVLVLAGGCTLPLGADKPALKQEQTPKPKAQPMMDLSVKPSELLKRGDARAMALVGPGKYGDDRYDRAKVEKELDKIPADASPEEIYDKLFALLANDYRPYVKKYDNFKAYIETKTTPMPKEAKLAALPEGKRMNVVILLDDSGSMAGKVPGGVKLDLAKKAVKEFAAKFPEGANVSLRVYGHKGTNQPKDKALSCQSSEVIYSSSRYEEGRLQQALNGLKPGGWTPLAKAIQDAQRDLVSRGGEGATNIVYVVSDGVETCGGDPVAAAQALHASNIQAVVNIIGFDVDDAGQRALKAVSDAGGGTFATVDNQTELEEAFDAEYNRLYDEWTRWGNENYDKVTKEGNRKYDELSKISNEFYNLKDQEINRLWDAKNYLDSKRGFIPDVGDMISQRSNLLGDYIFAVGNQLKEQVLKHQNEMQDAILEKQNKEQDRVLQKQS
jgi:Ca-activated chloride channel family protein